jgi:hypothetical protein
MFLCVCIYIYSIHILRVLCLVLPVHLQHTTAFWNMMRYTQDNTQLSKIHDNTG